MNIDHIIQQAQELGKKNWVHAMHILNSAADELPDEPRLQTSLAELFLIRLQYSNALKHYLRALSFQPDNQNLIQAIASCYLGQREYRLALVYFQRIKNQSDDVLYNIGYTQALLGKNRECIETMRKLLKRLPNHPYVYYVIIEQFYELGELDEAIRYLKNAQTLSGDHMQLSVFAGLIYSTKGQDMLAYYHYSKASKMGRINNPDHMIRYAMSALKAGLPREALKILQECEKYWPYLSEIYVNQMRTYLFLGDKKKAAEVLKRAKKNVSRLSPALRLMEERLKD
jgi:tetratricopeptide (TPR) repeat protein